VERGPQGRPTRTLIDALDEHGRRLQAEGRSVSWLRFTGYPFLFEWWAGAEWEFDGARGVWGEEQDFMPIERYRAYAREQV
jgi:hypothetical protein